MKIRYTIMGVVVNVLFFTALEITLRVLGFEYSRFPRLMQQESADAHVAWQNANRVRPHFVPDARRMWKPEPGFGDVNTLGYQGPLLPLERDPARRRILFLGDSCTNAGADQYPEKVVSLLASMGIAAEPLIAGVGGYSTYQGLLFLEEALVYRPDAVVAYFGWNDHWFAAAGVPDNEFKPLTAFEMASYRALSWLRTYQLMHYLIYPPNAPPRRLDFQALVELTRVPPTYFVENVDAMIELARRDAIPIFFVAPPYGKGLTNPAHDVLFPAALIPTVHLLSPLPRPPSRGRRQPLGCRRPDRRVARGVRRLTDGRGWHTPYRCRLLSNCRRDRPHARAEPESTGYGRGTGRHLRVHAHLSLQAWNISTSQSK
jgi:hypothetical protein